jgi:polyhydroxyalkanoate synthesis regulator phasin
MSKGLMTGQPKDQKEGRQWQLENKPYNSVMIGGKWRSINSIGPQSLIVLAGAKYNEEVQNTNGGGIGAFAGQLGKDQLNQTFLAGVQGPLNAITDPTRYGKSYIGNQMSSVVPNIVKDTSKSLDPYARENNTAIDYLKNSIPGVRNMSTPKRDALGNIIPQEPGGIGAFVDLFNSKTPISSPVIDELSRLNLTDNNATPSQISKDQTILKNKVVLNPEQLNKIEAESGTKLRDALNKLISSRGYQSLTDEKKAKAISDTTDSVRTLYKAQYGKDILSDVKLQNASYTTSKDSPQGISRVGLYGTALIDDPKATINAIVSGQPIRKISGKTVVLERQNNLSGLDAGDTTTQVDHKLALALGGTNDPDNLQVLSNEDNAAKGKFETYLAKQLVAGNITKKQAQEMDLDWRNQIGKLPVSEQTKIASAVKLELPESDPNLQFQIVNQTTGNVDNIDLTPIKEPTFTGDDIIDKKLKSAYKSALTRQTNDVIALYQDGQITLEQAKSYISDISSQSTSTKKKTKLTIKISNIKPALISNVKRSAKVKAPTIKFSKPKIKKTNIRRFTIK